MAPVRSPQYPKSKASPQYPKSKALQQAPTKPTVTSTRISMNKKPALRKP